LLCLIETAKQDLKENRAHQKKEVFSLFSLLEKKGLLEKVLQISLGKAWGMHLLSGVL